MVMCQRFPNESVLLNKCINSHITYILSLLLIKCFGFLSIFGSWTSIDIKWKILTLRLLIFILSSLDYWTYAGIKFKKFYIHILSIILYIKLTLAMLFSISFVSRFAFAKEMSWQIATFGILHTSGCYCGIVAFIYIYNKYYLLLYIFIYYYVFILVYIL